jgi:nitroreductase
MDWYLMTNPVIDAIKHRRSIRKFIDKPVEKTLIDEIINAGKYAPSAKNDQPWRFIVITNKEKISHLSKDVQNEMRSIVKKRMILRVSHKQLRNKETIAFLYGAAMAPNDVIFFNAPVLILVVTKNREFYDESCACCAQNMMLAAHSLGLGSCWIGFAHFLDQNKKVLTDLQIPSGYHISAALIIGHPQKKPGQPPIRKPMADVINWIQ